MPTLDNARWEQFAQLIVAGKDQLHAYGVAFGNRSEGARVNAHRLVARPLVAARIAELRAVVCDRLSVLTLADKRGFLHSVVTTAPGKIDENNPLCQSFKRRITTKKGGDTEEIIEYELPNKLKALELDAKLAGELQDATAGDRLSVSFFQITQERHEDAVERPVIDVEQA